MLFRRLTALVCALACAPLALGTVLALASPGAQAEGQRALTGSLTYLPRIALPEDARVQIEARSPFGDSLALFAQPTMGAQVPLPFTLDVPAGQELQLAIRVDSGPDTLWQAWPVEVAAGEGETDLGTLQLRPFQPFGPGFELLCAREGQPLRMQIGYAGDDALLVTPTGGVPLQVQISASGARFASADGRDEVWSKGDSALVTLDGAELGECRFVPPALAEEWRGQGNEPGWVARIADGWLALARQEGERLEVALAPQGIHEGAFLYAGEDEGAQTTVQVRLVPQLCHDSMTGMPYPDTLTLALGEEVLAGCGGDPLALLQGGEWLLEDLRGQGVIDDSHVSLRVGSGGQVAGSGGCNRYFGQAELSGEGLRFGAMGSTMMACAEALMTQEQRFHEALAEVDGFDLDPDGALLLRAGGETVALLRR